MVENPDTSEQPPPLLEVEIEIPRGSFLKQDGEGQLDFLSPFPCPFNYGSVETYLGGEGDWLDAVVLGPRLTRGSRVMARAYGAVGLSEGRFSDDKLICALEPIGAMERRNILRFFHFYAFCKGAYNVLRGRPGVSKCDGWCSAQDAIARATPIARPKAFKAARR